MLIHVNNSATDGNGAGEADENGSNPFDQIKQTCQNLFTSFTEKIATGMFIMTFYQSFYYSNTQSLLDFINLQLDAFLCYGYLSLSYVTKNRMF